MLINQNIEKFLSSQRLMPYWEYVKKHYPLLSDDEFAEAVNKLYIWNIQMSGAFLELFQLYEVALRNAILITLKRIYKFSLLDGAFIQHLNEAARKELLQNVNKIAESFDIVPYAFEHNKPLKIDCSKINENLVVSHLPFVFWENLLSQRYINKYWQHHYKRSFKNAKTSNTIKIIKKITNEIRELRNRICHNEPIYKNQHLRKIYLRALAVLKIIDIDLFQYVQQNTRRLNSLSEKSIGFLA